MTTRSNTDPDELLPLTDPEAIIRSGNAEQRRLKHLKSNPTIPHPPPSETTPAIAMSDDTAPAHETSGSTRTADAADMQTAKDWFKPNVDKLQRIADKLWRIAARTDRSLFLLIKPAPPALAD
ncbi:uncharacterized protein PGTG_00906 [Puccinia graminis f. sp. tritici CRL 75-36-700-3]|uniref:Uncharacterized protein n=1 Tax=Puccinia graminis f. sp. tritici (strain CRL 75-36-700-3 / race SCCL) TaxID=418459 RepID=E3JU50_PUCGT|nr:uncharacterized protein PGTG_00906 [Puccinia graminis f. sp. tritici CRL 75-36-700-3]EFP75575.1 hypothetical protein PGTG_00906 [Puccinia graminis f. sp. tritici CRL 75-36-700-3]